MCNQFLGVRYNSDTFIGKYGRVNMSSSNTSIKDNEQKLKSIKHRLSTFWLYEAVTVEQKTLEK